MAKPCRLACEGSLVLNKGPGQWNSRVLELLPSGPVRRGVRAFVKVPGRLSCPLTSRCLTEGAWVQGHGRRGSTEVHGIPGRDGVAVSAAQGTACSAETRADPGGLQRKVSLWASILGASKDRGDIFLSARKVDFYKKKALLGGELLPWGHGPMTPALTSRTWKPLELLDLLSGFISSLAPASCRTLLASGSRRSAPESELLCRSGLPSRCTQRPWEESPMV